MWLAVLALRSQEDEDRLKGFLEILFRDLKAHSYEFLFTKRTLFGPRDLGTLAPLLIEASRLGVEKEHVDWLRSVTGLPELEYHPGYTLHVRTLGRFALYRGTEEVPNREWQREKARSLFQLLVVNRKTFLHRDRIFDALWPGLDSDTAAKHLKVAFNTMLNVLEPDRPPRLSSFCIIRDGPLYGFNPHSGYWVDADEFESLATKAGRLAETDADGACDLYRAPLTSTAENSSRMPLRGLGHRRERLWPYISVQLRTSQNSLPWARRTNVSTYASRLLPKTYVGGGLPPLIFAISNGAQVDGAGAKESGITLRDDGSGAQPRYCSILDRVRMMPEE